MFWVQRQLQLYLLFSGVGNGLGFFDVDWVLAHRLPLGFPSAVYKRRMNILYDL